MDTNQPASVTTTTSAAPPRGMFGSKVPSSVAYLVGVLLFLMPFVDIRCAGTSLKTFSGLELATGFDPNIKESGGGLLDDFKEKSVDATSKATGKKQVSLFMLVALIAGGVGLLLSLTSSKALVGLALVAGLAGAGGLIAGMIDIKKEAKTNMKMPSMDDKLGDNDKIGDTDVGETVDKIGGKMNKMTDDVQITVNFTPWFYLSVVTFLAGAFFLLPANVGETIIHYHTFIHT